MLYSREYTHIDLPSLPAELFREIVPHADLTAAYILRMVSKNMPDVARTISLTTAAASDGHISVLKWAISEGYPYDEATTAAAAGSGHLEILKYLHEIVKCPWDSTTTQSAARGGHVITLEYAVDNKCDFNEQIVVDGANRGYLSIVEYSFTNQLCLDRLNQVCSAVVKNKHFHIIEWLVKNMPNFINTISFVAVICGHIYILDFLNGTNRFFYMVFNCYFK